MDAMRMAELLMVMAWSAPEESIGEHTAQGANEGSSGDDIAVLVGQGRDRLGCRGIAEQASAEEAEGEEAGHR